jgi:cysteine desulfurase
VKGAARFARDDGRGDGVVVTTFEHKAVLGSAARLEREGFRVARAGVNADGIVDLTSLEDRLDDRSVLVSVMLVNNEVGTIQPLDAVASVVRERAPRALLHTDAVQAVPWIDVARVAACADLVSISAHKFAGPKGVGVLARRGGVGLEPLIDGGGQEAGLRSGTTNVAGAVGLATALRLADTERASDATRVSALRDRLVDGLATRVPGCSFHGDSTRKVAGNVHVGFPGIEAEALLVLLDRHGVCAAAGSSCTSGATEPSHVLQAMGFARDQALASIRLTLGHASTDADIDVALDVIPVAVEQLQLVGSSAP